MHDGPPPGFLYRADLLTAAEEADLVRYVSAFEFAAVQMRGQVARRRTVHFGWVCGYESWRIEPGPPIPDVLLSLRARAAALAGVEPDALAEVRYAAGEALSTGHRWSAVARETHRSEPEQESGPPAISARPVLVSGRRGTPPLGVAGVPSVTVLLRLAAY